MLFVLCMLARRASLGPAPIPISRSMAALSTAPKSAAGGKSTTRKTEPPGGGATPISRAARSALPDTSAGDSSVTHKSVETTPVAFLSFAFGAAPSISTIDFPSASWPVPTRLVGCAMPWRGRRTSGGERPEAEFPLGLRYRGSVSRRNTPVIVPVGGPFPVFRLPGPVRTADALDLGGVLHRGAERRNEIREDVVAGPVTPRTPKGRYPRVLHPSDAAHDRIDVGHFECDVIEQGIVRLRVSDRVVDAVAEHEIHEPGAIGEAKAEHLHSEARAGFPVLRVEDDVRHLQGPVPVRSQPFHAFSFGDKPEHVALGALDEISASAAGFVEVARGAERRPRCRCAPADSRELGLRDGKSDCGHGGLACLPDRDHVRDVFRSPKIGYPVSLRTGAPCSNRPQSRDNCNASLREVLAGAPNPDTIPNPTSRKGREMKKS